MLNDISLDSRTESAILAVTKVDILGSIIVASARSRIIITLDQTLLERTRHITTIRSRQEDNLRVSTLSHRLHSLKVSDLHGRSRAENISSLSHQLCRLDFGARGNDLGFSDTLGLGSHGEGVLQLVGENDVFDEHGLDLDTPAGSDIFDDLADALSNLLTALNNVLEDAGSDYVSECGLGTLNECLADVANTKGSLVWAGNVVVDNTGELESDVVLGHADLLGNFHNLNLDIDLDEALGERVDLDETWVNGAVETTELGDETNVALRDRLVWVRAANTGWES